MMRSLRTSAMLLGVSVAVLGLAIWKVAIPAFEEGERRMLEAGRLLALGSQEAALRKECEAARGELERTLARVRTTVRAIPSEPDQAQLMRMLAVGADEDVGNQVITAGDPVPATTSDASPFRAVPVTVEMESTFARVMQVLARAERDVRLVRPIHVSIVRPADAAGDAKQGEASRFVNARIELDAVYGSALEGGSR
jgi:hypothetical protein